MSTITKLRLYQIGLPFDHSPELLKEVVLDKLGIASSELLEFKIIKRSLDARPGHRPNFIYSVDAAISKNITKEQLATLGKNIEFAKETCYDDEIQASIGSKILEQRPMILGSGPGGLFAAYWLAQHGYCPIVLEQGEPIEQRHKSIENFFKTRQLHPYSNYVFGEGGAGTYSDGKLYTGISSSWVNPILSVLAKHGGPPEIQYQFPPHIGSDRLRAVMIRMRQQIIEWGGEFRFQHRVEDIVIKEGQIQIVVTDKGQIPCQTLIVSPGSHCLETFAMLRRVGIAMELKPFQMGVRIEHPQDWVSRQQYRRYARDPHLPPASYRLVTPKTKDPHQVCTFCMCPGGEIIPASDRPNALVTNGMSNYNRNSGFANAALVTTITPEDLKSSNPMDGLQYRSSIEEKAFIMGGGNYTAPAQFAADFLQHKLSTVTMTTSYRFQLKSVALDKLLPNVIAQSLGKALPIFDQQMPGFVKIGLLIAPETRASCPVRLPRDTVTRQSPSCRWLYPVGEGAGYAGGIISAALDGIRTAITIINEFAPVKK